MRWFYVQVISRLHRVLARHAGHKQDVPTFHQCDQKKVLIEYVPLVPQYHVPLPSLNSLPALKIIR